MLNVTSRTSGFDVITTVVGDSQEAVEARAREIADNLYGYCPVVNLPANKVENEDHWRVTVVSARSCD